MTPEEIERAHLELERERLALERAKAELALDPWHYLLKLSASDGNSESIRCARKQHKKCRMTVLRPGQAPWSPGKQRLPPWLP